MLAVLLYLEFCPVTPTFELIENLVQCYHIFHKKHRKKQEWKAEVEWTLINDWQSYVMTREIARTISGAKGF